MCATVNGETLGTDLVHGFTDADFERVRSYLHDDLRAYITNRDGGVDEVRGADSYLGRVQAMDLPSASFRLDITQVVAVRPDLIMAMVEVHAARGGRTLHNHATHLFYLRDGRVSEWWMVEALPAESDAFWSQPG
jgi:hypothetical protein